MSQARVVIIGAGLSGLTVAARLVAAGRRVLVLEASSRVGGQIETWRQGELIVELGAEGFVARSRALPALAHFLGIEAALVDQLTTDTYALEGNERVLLPPGEAARRLGFQVPPEELGRGIRSFALGMGQLTGALLARVGTERVRLAAPVTAIVRRGHELRVQLASGAVEDAGVVVMAAPARRAAAMLGPLAVVEGAPLLGASLLSNVSVNLLYQRAQLASYPAGSGLVFPAGFADVGLRALSLVDQKFAGRVGAGQSLLRLFFRPVGDSLESWSDARFALEAAQAIARVLPVQGPPQQTWVSRWADALPVFTAAYKAEAAAADQALQALGIHVTGSAFHGAGIDAAVSSAEIVAARLASS